MIFRTITTLRDAIVVWCFLNMENQIKMSSNYKMNKIIRK